MPKSMTEKRKEALQRLERNAPPYASTRDRGRKKPGPARTEEQRQAEIARLRTLTARG